MMCVCATRQSSVKRNLFFTVLHNALYMAHAFIILSSSARSFSRVIVIVKEFCIKKKKRKLMTKNLVRSQVGTVSVHVVNCRRVC